jgi:hypothetical protein
MKHNYVAIFVLCLSCGKITGTNTESLTHSDNGGWLEASSAGKTNYDPNQGGFAGVEIKGGSAGETIHITNYSGSAGEAGISSNYITIDNMNSLDGWVIDRNENSNPVILPEATNGTVKFSTASEGSPVGSCATIYNFKEYQVSETNLELCFELDASGFIAEEPTYYNLAAVRIELFSGSESVSDQYFYIDDSIGDYFSSPEAENFRNTHNMIRLESDGCQTLPITETVLFDKLRLSAVNYTCIGINYVIFDELRLLSNDI